jgi:hypothetical protein
MVHRYVQYNSYGLTIRVNLMVKYVCVDFGSIGFMTKTQPFPMNGHYRMYVISDVSHLRLDSVVLLVLRIVCCAMARTLALYYKSLRITSTLLRRDNISDRPYC